MTGELPPAGDGPGAEARPELRASHEDRDRVVEILRVAAGDGRLTADELDERLEAALTARTHRELAALTADLPAAGGGPGGDSAQAKDLVRIDSFAGNASRVGGWVVPQQMEIRCVGGNVKLDFTEAVITRPALQIELELRGGNFILVTKPGIDVDLDEVAMRGGSVKSRPGTGPKRPVIFRVEVSGEVRGGNVVVRPRRRTFWQWLLRRPAPYHRSITA
jgi:Domain of unknown function (DUF1707)